VRESRRMKVWSPIAKDWKSASCECYGRIRDELEATLEGDFDVPQRRTGTKRR